MRSCNVTLSCQRRTINKIQQDKRYCRYSHAIIDLIWILQRSKHQRFISFMFDDVKRFARKWKTYYIIKFDMNGKSNRKNIIRMWTERNVSIELIYCMCHFITSVYLRLCTFACLICLQFSLFSIRTEIHSLHFAIVRCLHFPCSHLFSFHCKNETHANSILVLLFFRFYFHLIKFIYFEYVSPSYVLFHF